MLAAAHRMRRAQDFSHVMRRGARRARGSVVIHLTHAHQGQAALVGFVVARSVGGAVQRNLVKRRLRSVMSGLVEQLPGCWVVVRALPSSADASFDQLRSDVVTALDEVRSVRGRR